MFHKYFKQNLWTKCNAAQGDKFEGKPSNYEGGIQECMQQNY